MMALLMLATVAIAQPQRGGQGGPRGAKGLPFAELELTEEQKAQVKEIQQSTRTDIQALRADKEEQGQNRDAMKKIMEDSRVKIEAVLTPEQKTKLAALKAERKDAWESVDKEALKTDLKAHSKEVKAVVAAARAQLDAFITAEDQASIERLRGVFASRPKLTREGKKGRASGEAEDKSEKRQAMSAWAEAHAGDIEEAKALTEKYREDIARIHEKLKPQAKEWKEEKREILDSYFPEEIKAGNIGSRTDKAGARKQGKGQKGGKKAKKGVAFLLMKS